MNILEKYKGLEPIIIVNIKYGKNTRTKICDNTGYDEEMVDQGLKELKKQEKIDFKMERVWYIKKEGEEV